MILSVSRRTDIPAFYSNWFMNRVRQEFVLVRNPMNYHQVSKVRLSPEVIDCIVFWTKNAAPLMPHIDEIAQKYEFYFQYSINAYGRDIEQNLPSLSDRIDTFKRLSDKIGPQRIIWRYDPILMSDQIDVRWHCDQYNTLAQKLSGYTEKCIFSFIDLYDKVKNNVSKLCIRACTLDEMKKIAKEISAIALSNNLMLQTCAEEIDLDLYGIEHGHCIDGKLIEHLTGKKLNAKKDKNQRDVCGCLESIDIGQYNTCRHGCKYCYANFNPQSVITFSNQHNPDSPFLIGLQEEKDRINDRKMKSLLEPRSEQMSMFSSQG